MTHAHAGVGCGRDVIPCPGGSEFNSRPFCPYTSGSVTIRLGWAVDSSGQLMAPPRHFWTLLRCGFDDNGKKKLVEHRYLSFEGKSHVHFEVAGNYRYLLTNFCQFFITSYKLYFKHPKGNLKILCIPDGARVSTYLLIF